MYYGWWAETRVEFGKSTLSAPFMMTKMMLYPNFQTYILSLTAMQSQDTWNLYENGKNS